MSTTTNSPIYYKETFIERIIGKCGQNWFLVIVWLWLALSAGASRAQEPMTLDQAVERALTNNRDLRAAYQSVEVARGRLIQAGLWPNPALEIAGRTAAVITGENERNVGVAFAQEFPITRRLALAKEVSRVDVVLALTEIRNRERLLIGQVETEFINLLLLRRQIAQRDESKQISVEF